VIRRYFDIFVDANIHILIAHATKYREFYYVVIVLHTIYIYGIFGISGWCKYSYINSIYDQISVV